MNNDSNPIVATLHDLADGSGATIGPYFRSGISVDNKAADDRFDPVTEADRAAEQSIRALLAQRFPEHGILGEEFAATTSTGTTDTYQWVIDPIDGTRAFILGLPTWGTLIGLKHNGVPVMGLMDQPYTRERFWSDGNASYFRGADGKIAQLKTRPTQLDTAQLSTTTPDMFSEAQDRRAFDAVNARVRACRYGGDCYAYCLLAMGLIDIVMEADLKPYDIVALIPIIENAGGIVTDWQGGSAADGGCVIACGDHRVHDELLDIIAKANA